MSPLLQFVKTHDADDLKALKEAIFPLVMMFWGRVFGVSTQLFAKIEAKGLPMQALEGDQLATVEDAIISALGGIKDSRYLIAEVNLVVVEMMQKVTSLPRGCLSKKEQSIQQPKRISNAPKSHSFASFFSRNEHASKNELVVSDTSISAGVVQEDDFSKKDGAKLFQEKSLQSNRVVHGRASRSAMDLRLEKKQ